MPFHFAKVANWMLQKNNLVWQLSCDQNTLTQNKCTSDSMQLVQIDLKFFPVKVFFQSADLALIVDKKVIVTLQIYIERNAFLLEVWGLRFGGFEVSDSCSLDTILNKTIFLWLVKADDGPIQCTHVASHVN